MKIKIVLSIPVPSILLTQNADEFIDALHQLLSGGMYLTVEVFVQVLPPDTPSNPMPGTL